MNEKDLKQLLSQMMSGETSINDVVSRLKNSLLRTTELGFAQPDHHRALRHGLNEVIYGKNKTSDQIIEIASHLAAYQQCVLISRLNTKKLAALKEAFPQGRVNEMAKTFMIHTPALLDENDNDFFVAIVTAGTSDICVAEEACEVCIAMQIPFKRIYDVGVAGLHRIMNSLHVLQKASTVIVIAGMEGALPSVVGGLVGSPIIAVPTSVGYGASFKGVAALLGMLNSCAPGLVVTNIDAGFSAGFAACRIIQRMNINENTLS